MFNRLFGRKELQTQIEVLQTRINELESENKLLSTRLSKRDIQTKKAVSDKQGADLALKKAASRIEYLEHELEKQKEQKQITFNRTRSFTVTNAQSCDLLFRIGSIRSKNENLVTVYLRPEESIHDLDGFESTVALDQEVKHRMQRIESPTGMALFYDLNRIGIVSMIVTPPFPIRESEWRLGHAFETKQLQEILYSNQIVCIVLTHAGATFIGISNREAFIDYKIVRSSVKEKHAKGGWSQRRFERLREEDIRHHAEKARDAFEALLGEYKNEIKIVVASGETNLIKAITQGYSYSYPFPLLLRSMNVNATIEKKNIDMIRVLAWSSRWYSRGRDSDEATTEFWKGYVK
ncbi:hypothetical protein ES705_17135 [subsurface metagenome]|nr:hypothetical protein [Methanosarcinales archaeon]